MADGERGRRSLYTDELAEEICDRLSEGEPLAHICLDDHMPAVSTVYDWREAHKDFSVGFARARDRGFDRIAADCLAIADDKSGDVIKGGRRAGELDKEFAERSKIRIETRLKLLAKWDPKRYGEKATVDMNVTGDIAALIEAGRKRARGEK